MHAIIVKCEFFFWKKLELQCMFIWVYCNISIFQYRLTYFIVILKGLSPEQFSLLHFWTVKYMKKNLDKTKPGCTTVILRNIFCQSLGFRTLYWGSTCSWLSRLKKPQLAEYLRNRCLFSRVTSWLIIMVTEPKFTES